MLYTEYKKVVAHKYGNTSKIRKLIKGPFVILIGMVQHIWLLN